MWDLKYFPSLAAAAIGILAVALSFVLPDGAMQQRFRRGGGLFLLLTIVFLVYFVVLR
ncbi:MAG: hypothetical protein M3T56_19015 [Chloroflexota bacterium]|nr:hypothetical protein [Chloroflexota bacterium]